jgi:site-specific DNA recombinase
VVYRLDRLSRNVVDVYNALDLFHEKDVAFVSVQEAFDTTTAMGRAMLGVAAVFAQLTREMISENTKDGLLRRVQSGKYVGSPRTCPYGYAWSEGALSVVPEQAAVVRRIFTLYTQEAWGALRIAALLNRESIRGQSGQTDAWRQSTIARMLRNPIYAGRVRIKQKEFAGEHEAIIEPELFAATQELAKRRADMAPRTKNTPHLLSGIATCGQCGRNLRTHQQVSRIGSIPYVSYRHTRTATSTPCLTIYKAATALEQAVIDEVRRQCLDPQLRSSALQIARSEFGSKQAPLACEKEQLLRTLTDADAEFAKWAERLTKGLIDEHQFGILNQKQMEDRRALRQRLEQIEAELARGEDLALTMEEVEHALDDFMGVWDILSPEERREMMRAIIEQLRVYPEHAELKLLCLPEVRLDLKLKRGRKPHVGKPC